MSEKCAAAKEWNINIVNHLWLEESYAKGQIQTLTNPRYTHFPRRTNLGEVVGQTQLNVDAVKKSEGIIPANAVAVSSSLPDGKVQQRRQQPASHHAHAVSPSSHAPSQLQQRKSGSGRPASATASANGTPRPNGAATNNADDAALQTPLAERFRDGKEIDTPSTNGSRGAKARALSKLHDLAPDMALYEKEAKRVGGVVYGGRKVSDPDRIGGEKRKVSGGRSRKRSVEERDEEDDDSRHEVGVEFGEGEDETDDSMEVDNKSVHKSKKAKGAKNAKHDIVHRVMLSGDQRWVDKQRKEADEKVSHDATVIYSKIPLFSFIHPFFDPILTILTYITQKGQAPRNRHPNHAVPRRRDHPLRPQDRAHEEVRLRHRIRTHHRQHLFSRLLPKAQQDPPLHHRPPARRQSQRRAVRLQPGRGAAARKS